MALPTTGVLLLHNPRCSKSRALKAALDERGVSYAERRYLDEPLARDELADLAERLGGPVRDLVRAKEKAYAEAGLSERSSEAELLDAIERHPVLLERPVLVKGRRAAIGRPGPDDALVVL